MYEGDDDDDDKDGDEYGEQMTFDDFKAGMNVEGLEDHEDNMTGFNFHEDDNSDEDEAESEEGDGRDTMARLKDDLFADEEEPQTGPY
jgi:U3 small nucleolar RNA-associated protein MPP10